MFSTITHSWDCSWTPWATWAIVRWSETCQSCGLWVLVEVWWWWCWLLEFIDLEDRRMGIALLGSWNYGNTNSGFGQGQLMLIVDTILQFYFILFFKMKIILLFDDLLLFFIFAIWMKNFEIFYILKLF